MTADPLQPQPRTAPPNTRRWRMWLAIAAIALMLGGIGFWIYRAQAPIRPTQLSPQEMAAVQAKLEALQQPSGPSYERGSKEIKLTERELNGLLNRNTKLGDTVRLELAKDAIHARIETDLDPDIPLVGGKRFKARARFVLKQDEGRTVVVLDDVTVWGISLPNDWLGQLKGRDLLGEAFGTARGRMPGVEEFRIEDGMMTIRLAE